MVSTSSILCLIISFVLAFLLPIGAVVFLAVKKKLRWKAVLFGAILFPVFALGLERLGLHRLVLGAFPGLPLRPYLFGLYGGLAAGVFEETARLVGFKLLFLLKEDKSPYTGISYGLGHGGIEAILLGGLAAIGNFVFALMVNGGATPAGMELAAQQLAAIPSYQLLFIGVERVFAMTIQIALSMIVMKAVIERKYWFFVLAIGLHAVVDFPAVLYPVGIIKNLFLIEGFVLIIAVAYALLAYWLFKKRPSEPEMA